jgi:proline dehydrogenase
MALMNRVLVKVLPIFPRSFIYLFAQRYIAGETLDDAIRVSHQLNGQGMWVTMDVLGENITRLEEARAAKDACLRVLDAIDKNNVQGNISIKLTQMGLKIDKEACIDHVHEIVERARSYSNFVRIDMEDSSCTDDTIEICLRMREVYDRVGTVIQAYLKRSVDDVKELASKGVNLRICKGIYDEPPEIAYKDRNEIRENFMRLVNIMMDHRVYVAIATHDKVLIDQSYQEISRRQLKKEAYEFQMLLGVAERLRGKIVSDGHHLRVYVPFGQHWYPYSIRRMKENPQLAGYIVQNLFKRMFRRF